MVDLHGSDRDRGSFRFGLLLLLKSERMMIWKRKMREAFQTKRSARIIAVLTGAVIAVAAAGYLFFHNPYQYPLPGVRCRAGKLFYFTWKILYGIPV